MSHSTLYGITSDLHGAELNNYHNAWLFCPAIWQFLELKYRTGSVIGFSITEGEKQLNKIMNKGENIVEQICWELSNQQVFCTKDKDFVADCIEKFMKEAQLEGTVYEDRFRLVAADIRNIDTSKYKFFVFKNISVDNWVENWFLRYDAELDTAVDCSLLDIDYFRNELVEIDQTNNCVSRFIPPEEFKETYKQYM
jgi:hypothetical protein